MLNKGKSEVQKLVLERDSILWKCFVQKGKSVVQESLLDFGTHPLGSVLCIRKQCSVRKEDSKGSSVA